MDLEVLGCHALLFDDDAAAAFVNSTDALVEWHSLFIDRYDVRHLLSSPLPPRRRRNPQQTHPSSSPPSASSLESDLEHERYLDLPPPSDEQELDAAEKSVDAAGYRAVAFSYGNADDSSDQKDGDAGLGCSGFHPPFPVLESLLQNLPPTEKVHQIIARTALFVSKHGGQSEIVLRVKQGDNPTFGFLMPDHDLHAYFRFLVDHQELLDSDIDGKPQNEEKKADAVHNQTDGVEGGALSLLGSLYGSGEDEDGAAEDASECKENVSRESFDAVNATVSHGFQKAGFSVNAAGKDEGVSMHPLPSKEKASALRRNCVTSATKAGSSGSTRKENDSIGSLSAAADKSHASALPAKSKIEPLILEPPSDLKRLVDKIVEFIMRNGKQFEAVLVEQDSKHGRFPFLLPSNQYHPYYLNVLQKAQESKLKGRSFFSGKDDSVGHVTDKKSSLSKESDTLSLASAGGDMPYDSERKEKFKMVIGKSKKDGQDAPSKATQQQFGVSVDAAAAAAILQAATRGIRNPNLGILSSSSLNCNSNGRSSEGGQASSMGSLPSSYPEGIIQKSDRDELIISVPAAKAIANTVALEAASEADSSEAHLTREQKLKAERLKRAKMFVAVLKSGNAPFKTEPLRGLSAEPGESGFSGSGAEVNLLAKEREGSSAPLDVDISEKNIQSEMKNFGDDYNERRSRRKYRSRSGRHEEDEEEEDDEEEREHRHSRKKRRSHYSTHDDEEEKDVEERHNKHSRKKHQSEEEKVDEERDHKYSRKKHRSHRSSREDEEEDDDRVRKHSRKKHRSHHSSHHSRDKHKHRKTHSNDRESRHRHKHDSSSNDEHQHHSRSDKHIKRSHSEKEELEEGEIGSKISDQSRGTADGSASREASLDLPSAYQDKRAQSQPSETTEVSDDLRAKIRAMLMATL